MDFKLDGRKRELEIINKINKTVKTDTTTLSRYILALKGNKMAFKMQCNDEFYLFFPTLC